MKKTAQLGMNPGTASQRLVKDLLFDFVQKAGHVCFRCGGELSRGDFSIEHKEPWLDSDDPLGLFFDLNNIAYSHRDCNTKDRRIVKTAKHGTRSRYQSGCRCVECKAATSQYARQNYDPQYRHDRWKKNGT
jgi:hypothetical protein